ncbi:MAG: hypothetical protein NTU53_14515 [Planctomycetota bacterium]|nr:hypothetical protein [Planctomycetota bacterium]
MRSVQVILEIVGYHDCKSVWAQASKLAKNKRFDVKQILWCAGDHILDRGGLTDDGGSVGSQESLGIAW